MRKTLALFVLALSMLVVALIVGLRGTPLRPEPKIEPPPPVVVTPPDPPKPPPSADGRATLSMGDVVHLDGTLSNGFLRASQPGPLSILVDLTARDVGGTERSPMAVAIVIDRSGSMAGEKIRAARSAAKQFAGRLSDEDQLAIVTYSTDYSVDLPLTTLKGQRGRVDRIIDDILDGGGTDIGGGMQAGLTTLRTARPGAIKRLLLVSDGNANQGITDSNALAAIARHGQQEGVTVSTLGVGLDFNEDLLAQMAQAAGGGYYYARSGDAINAAFDKELAGLTRLAARNVEVGLELGTGVSIAEVYGYRTEMRRGRVIIPIGDMAAGEHRRVLVQLQSSGAPAGKVDVSNVVLAYNIAGGEDVREHQGLLAAVATADEHELTSGERREVAEAFEAARAAKARETAAFSFQSGQKQQAMRHLKQQIVDTRARNATLNSPVVEAQVNEMEDALRGISSAPGADSDEGKDLVKREKLRAREVFAY